MHQAPDLTISITSDFICPWCLIGARRLQKAIREFQPAIVQTRWLPFRLNKHMPEKGLERRAYRIAKFGSWERSLGLDAQVAAVAQADGIEIAYERMIRTPNTTAAHRLMRLAEHEGDPSSLANRLFDAYFLQGTDLSDHDKLADIATASGLHADKVREVLGSDTYMAEFLALEEKAYAAGVDGVPTFQIGTATIIGAQSVEALSSAISRSLADRC